MNTTTHSQKVAHTPGPWQIVKDLSFPFEKLFVSPEGRDEIKIATLEHDLDQGKRKEGWQTELANGRLIAAAPELLEACRDSLREYVGLNLDRLPVGEHKRLRRLMAAIAKAEGRT